MYDLVKSNLTKPSQSKSFPILTPFKQSLQNFKKVKEFLSAVKIFLNTPKPSVGTSTKTERLANAIERRKKKMTTWVFPGQGSQEKSMGATLFDGKADLTAQASRGDFRLFH
ncbi:MAG: hypothetical protein B6247_00605 [Candidatus Parabeggiatoa sp. nov. 2]|nr:MAG: hypothetical protein B6247_00605 [Beggiatoa sp. 4572_84]